MKLRPSRPRFVPLACLLASLAGSTISPAREWKFVGISEPMEAEFVAMSNDYVVLRGENEKSFELPLERFSEPDQRYLRALAAGPSATGLNEPGEPVTSASGYKTETVETLAARTTTIGAATELRVTGADDPLAGSLVEFTSPDGWLFLDQLLPSVVETRFIDRFLIGGDVARPGENIRVVRHGSGTVVIPHPPGFPAMTVFSEPNRGGASITLESYAKYDDAGLLELKDDASSFILRRGYMATIAQNDDGTGISRNYVAQDHDVVIDKLPPELADNVSFIRIFPWRPVGKKGIAGGIHQNLDVGWYYDWNIEGRSSADVEYVAIKQNRHWPGLEQDWEFKGINHLLGFNEPDRPDQANMTVDQAIAGWPELLGTGLRLGSPAVSDGGLGWLYEFMDKADAANLRVDFVAVHYYRATADPGDEKAAAAQFHDFLKRIHDRVKRPLWITEWNNGANWTSPPDPSYREQRDAIETMIEMLDETPFVERYALYNWVEETRKLVRDDGSLTPAGEIYRDRRSPVFFTQP